MLKNLTDAEKQALGDLLYLVTHDEAANAAILATYGTARAGNSDMMPTRDFAATLDSLYTKAWTSWTCK
jgi:hypothetical protein